MTYPCPFCGAAASGETGCPACGRGPVPVALEVVRLDGVIAELTARLDATRRTAQQLDGELKQTWVRRAAAAAEVRVLVAHSQPPAVPGPSTIRAPRRDDASTRWIQNALFLLGGVLLAVAAIVFTAVAWAQFGVGGRAAVLAAFTGAALAVPGPAVRRGLAATAETFAAVGLLLVLLDGYAAWYVDLLGVTRISPWTYAAAVGTVTAALTRVFPRLTGPRYAALLIAQPVLPLVAVPAHFGPLGHAYTYAGVLLLDLVAVRATRSAVRVVAGCLAAVAALPTGAFALIALLEAGSVAGVATAGGALVLTAVLPLCALSLPSLSPRTRSLRAQPQPAQPQPAQPQPAQPQPARSLSIPEPGSRPTRSALLACLLVVEVAAVVVRAAVLVAPSHPLPAVSLALLAVAVLALTVRRIWLDGPVARGVRLGTGVALTPFALAAFAAAAGNAAGALVAARPLFAASWTAVVPRTGTGPSLPLVVAVLAAAIAVTVPRAWRPLVVLVAGALALVALPAALSMPWWTAPILDLSGVAAALMLASRYGSPLTTADRAATPDAVARVVLFVSQVVTALTLALHGAATAFGAAAVAAPALATLMAVTAGLAFGTRRGPRRLDLGGPGLVVSLLLVPAVAWTTAAALGASSPVQSRVALAGALLPAAAYHLTARRLGDLRLVALAATLVPPAVAPLWAGGDSVGIYAAVSLLALATLPAGWWTGLAAAIPGAALLITTTGPLAHALTDRNPHVAASVPVAFALLSAAALVRSRRPADVALPLFAVTAVMALAAVGVPWPYGPAAALSLGLAGLLASALTRRGVFLGVVAALLAGAGVARLLPSHAAAIAALGAVLVVAAVAGVAGRTLAARLTGWITAVVAAAGVVHHVVALAGARPAYPLLGLAAGTLAVSALLRHRTVESRAVEAAAHATAVLAVLLTPHDPVPWFVWGAALGVRALRRAHRDAYLIAAAVAELAGWCLLLVTHRVGVVEAYAVPSAAVALLAGLTARRRQPGLTSWAAYGPALAAALLPSLAVVLSHDGEHPRRLLLGLAALAVLLAGARARLQGPVLIGGGVLGVLALHELALVWDLVPRWIPLAAAGLLLVGLAMTLERRRRDLDRLRSALTRMT